MEIEALGAQNKLTLPFESCAAFGDGPVGAIDKYHDSLLVAFIAAAGTRIVAPWDGTVEVYPLDLRFDGGGYIAHISNTSRTLDARIYLFQDASNPAYGRFLANPGQLEEVRRGDLIGFAGSSLPVEMSDVGATVGLGLTDWAGLTPLDPFLGEYWAGGEMNFQAQGS